MIVAKGARYYKYLWEIEKEGYNEETMKASDLLVRCLEEEGVKYIFGVPGEENEDLLFSLEDSSITFIPTRHEQGAAFMADVWGRLTGKAGVCLSTLGPGATNLITGLADAHMDKSPVVAITGQGSSTRFHKESHQFIDVVSILRPITKWNISIQNPRIIPEAVRKAFKLAQVEKPGVTHLELPEDVAKISVEARPIPARLIRRPAPDYKAIGEALVLLSQAKRPVILAGNGAIRKLASKQLSLFVAKTNIPVVTTFMGKGAISDRDMHALGTIGLRGRDFPLCALDAADLLITVGYDIAEFAPEAWNSDNSRPIIHIDFIPSEVDACYHSAVELIADISATLFELHKQVGEHVRLPFSSWFSPIHGEMVKDREGYTMDKGKGITIPWVLARLRGMMHDDDIIISDVGAHKMWVGRNFPIFTPGTCIISNGFASMGIAVPGGIAAKLAFPEKRVVAFTGDGGFLMNSQEIETAKRIGAHYTILVVNDNDYGLISWKQETHTGKSFGTRLTNPDFALYGKSFGIPAYYPKTKKAFTGALKKAIRSEALSLVAVDIDAKENMKLTQKLQSGLCAPFKF